MSAKWHVLIGTIIFLVGIGGIVFYDFYYKPEYLSTNVVKVNVQDQDYLTRNYILQPDDLYIDKVPKEHLPDGYIRSKDEAVHKMLNVNVKHGMILTDTMVDVDELAPKENEGIFPLSPSSIYAINGTLRGRDRVNIYLMDMGRVNKLEDEDEPDEKDLFLENVTVAYVRASNNHDVQDTESGNTNQRITSTANVAYPEIILTNEQGIHLKNMIEKGYMLWIVRQP